MPPRKRARLSQATSPQSSQPKTPTPVADAHDDEQEGVPIDHWTDDEEIGLFKGLIRWKPTGIHKHFHLLSLHQFMLSNGYIQSKNEHTKPAGIWQKLQTLYNLDALDEREDARQLDKVRIPEEYRLRPSDDEESSSESDDADVYSEAENKIASDEFDLTGEAFAQLKWERRLGERRPTRSESPPLLPELNLAELAPVRFTPSFSIEPPDIATPAARRGRPRAGTASTKAKATPTAAIRRRSVRQAGSVDTGDDEEEKQDGAQDDGEEEDEDDGEEQSEEEDESEDNHSVTRSKRSAKPGKTRGIEKPQTRTRTRR